MKYSTVLYWIGMKKEKYCTNSMLFPLVSLLLLLFIFDIFYRILYEQSIGIKELY